MAKGPTLNRLSTINGAENDINDNSTRIEAAFENTFSLDGSTPNALQADLDLNGNDVLNSGILNTDRVNTTTLTIDGELVVPQSVALSPDAIDVQIADGGSFYTGVTVEDALQEVGSYTSVTATPAELNTLDGITATVTELNHTDGVTSNIQTQLNNKQPLDSTLTTLSGQTVTAAGLALLDDADNTAQRTTLGLGGLAVENILDEDDFSSDSETRPPSQQSVGAYIANRVFESSPQTITTAGSVTVAHGLGARPNSISLLLQNVTPEHNYTAGQTIFIDAMQRPQAGATTNGCTPRADATNVTVRYGDGSSVFIAVNANTGAIEFLTNANWRLIIVASL